MIYTRGDGRWALADSCTSTGWWERKTCCLEVPSCIGAGPGPSDSFWHPERWCPTQATASCSASWLRLFVLFSFFSKTCATLATSCFHARARAHYHVQGLLPWVQWWTRSSSWQWLGVDRAWQSPTFHTRPSLTSLSCALKCQIGMLLHSALFLFFHDTLTATCFNIVLSFPCLFSCCTDFPNLCPPPFFLVVVMPLRVIAATEPWMCY